MTQPPDDRRPLPWEASGEPPADPEDQPTTAWTPPGAEPPSAAEPPPAEPPAAEPASPAEPAPVEPSPDAPAMASEDATVTPSPIISAAPIGSEGAAAAAPVVGWEQPKEPAAGPAGDVISGMGARIVAYLLDSTLVAIVPTALTFTVFNYAEIFRDSIEAARLGETVAVEQAITTEIILVTLIGLGISFIYFVGFWTSGGRATLGMRGLKMRIVDARTGGTIGLGSAIKRWIVLGAPLSLLALVPPVASIAGFAEIGLLLLLFITALGNDLRQGLHDRVAGSVIIRSPTSGSGATAVGCIVLIALWILITIVVSALLFAQLGPVFEDIILESGSSI
jgi:uncharacterized RDD family membrane protein YckC